MGSPGMAADKRLQRAQEIKAAHEAELMRHPGVVGVGIGHRRSDAVGHEFVIVVSVAEAESSARRRSGRGIPRELGGIPVEVRVVGTLRAIVARAREVRARHTKGLLQRPNVVGVGVGYKQTAGITTDELSLVVSVVRKLPATALAPGDLIPQSLDGVRTDVVETGRLIALGSGTRDRWRPVVPPGVSLGHSGITAGTFGCLVRRGERSYVLSNNHVLADSNRGQIGDAILQPGAADGGGAADRVAVLSDFVPIDFGTKTSECPIADLTATIVNWAARAIGSSHRVRAVQETPGVNYADAAIAEPLSPNMVRSEILFIGAPVGTGTASLGMRVQKTGRTTGYTQGTVSQIDATVRIDYGGQQATFSGQFIAGPMSQPGDSGSAVLDVDRRVVGLLFAGSDLTTVCNPIASVLSALEVELEL